MSANDIQRLTQSRMVEIPTVLVVKPIVASPGDRLLIFEGVCLGVDTSRPAPRALPAPLPPEPPAVPHKPGTGHAKAGTRSKPGRGPAQVLGSAWRKTTDNRRRAVLLALLDGGPLSKQQILAKVHYSNPKSLSADLRLMHRLVVTERVPNVSNANGGWLYTLTRTGSKVANNLKRRAEAE